MLKPNVEDEKVDVGMLCTMPKEADADGLDESQQMRIACEVYEERLTTGKWRAWIRDGFEKGQQLDDTQRAALRRSQADDLASAAKKQNVSGECWFERGLRSSSSPKE